MEEYLLNIVLSWKLSYVTPFDIIQTLSYKISLSNSQYKKNIDIIIKKAVQISELLLICTFLFVVIVYDTLNNYSILSIALASLYGSLQILGIDELFICIDEFAPKKNQVYFALYIDGY